MALPINPLNTNAMAALAGQRAPYLNLPLFGQGVLQATEDKAKLDQQYASMQQQGQLDQAQMANQFNIAKYGEQQMNTRQQAMLQQQAQQAGLDRDQKMTLAQMGNQLEQAKMNQQNQQFGQELGLKQQELGSTSAYQQGMLGVEQQKAQQEYQLQQVQAMMMLQQNELNKAGAAGALLSMGLNQYSNDPKKQQQFVQSALPTLIKEGLISNDQAQQYASMDPQQLQQAAASHVLLAGMAKQGMNGNMAGMMPTAMNIFGNFQPGKSTLDQVQQEQVGANRSTQEVTNLLANFNPELFSTKANIQATVGNEASRMGLGSLPGVSFATDLAAQRAAFSSNTLSSIMATLQQQKGVRFNKMSVDVLTPEVPNPEKDGPEVAFSKIVTLNQRMQRAASMADQLQSQGLKPDDKEYQEKINEAIQSPAPGKITFKTQAGNLVQADYQTVKQIAEKNNLTFPDAMKYVLSRQVQ